MFSLTKVPVTIHRERLSLITENIEIAVLALLDLLGSLLHFFLSFTVCQDMPETATISVVWHLIHFPVFHFGL